MNWIKSNWLIIVLSVVALAALPTMWYFSSQMNKRLRVQVDKEVQADWREVTASTVTYHIPDIKKPDSRAFEKTAPVNEILTKKFAEVRDAIKRESAQIGEEAVKFNQGNRKPLVDGLFPMPPAGDRNRVMYQFVRVFVENLPRDLLARAGARPPTDPDVLGQVLAEYKRSREERQRATQGTAVSPEEAAKLEQELLAQRVDRYRAWANQTCFYADDQIFLDIPETLPNSLPSMAKLWDWQMKAWILEDLFKAFALANSTTAGGGDGSVLTGAIKRVMKIQIDGMDYHDVPDEQAGTVQPDPSAPPPKEPVTPDITVSVTGRYSGPRSGNQVYDLRVATVEMVVAPSRLAAFYDALVKTNYMTVLQVELTALQPEDDLKKGYYYGEDHVVKAQMKIETIWLRAWTKQYMPKTVRVQLNIPEDAPANPEELPPQ